jgi:hypothetical protein
MSFQVLVEIDALEVLQHHLGLLVVELPDVEDLDSVRYGRGRTTVSTCFPGAVLKWRPCRDRVPDRSEATRVEERVT